MIRIQNYVGKNAFRPVFQNAPVIALLLCMSLGCNSSQSKTSVRWQCSLEEVDGVAVIDCDKLRLIFTDLKLESSPLKEGGGASFSILVAGPGTEDSSVVAHKTKVSASYRNGQTTITVGDNGTAIKVLENGKQLRVGDTLFPLSEKKFTLVIDAVGRATRKSQD